MKTTKEKMPASKPSTAVKSDQSVNPPRKTNKMPQNPAAQDKGGLSISQKRA